MAFRRYTVANGQMIAQQLTDGTRVGFQRDALGSVVGTVTSAGAVAKTYRFKPYGTTLATTGTGTDPEYLWNGTNQYRGGPTSHASHYVRARHYGESEGRFPTVDPLWPWERAYPYVNGSPATLVDPTGAGPRPSSGTRATYATHQGLNFAQCAVYVCTEHVYAWARWIPTHKYVCVTGPHGGCSGGLYPTKSPWGPGGVGNRQMRCNSEGPTTCELVSTKCPIAEATCTCLKRFETDPPDYHAPFSTCFTFPDTVLGCACNSLKDPGWRETCIEDIMKWNSRGTNLPVVAAP